jgi:hypothetical protein
MPRTFDEALAFAVVNPLHSLATLVVSNHSELVKLILGDQTARTRTRAEIPDGCQQNSVKS